MFLKIFKIFIFIFIFTLPFVSVPMIAELSASLMIGFRLYTNTLTQQALHPLLWICVFRDHIQSAVHFYVCHFFLLGCHVFLCVHVGGILLLFCDAGECQAGALSLIYTPVPGGRFSVGSEMCGKLVSHICEFASIFSASQLARVL